MRTAGRMGTKLAIRAGPGPFIKGAKTNAPRVSLGAFILTLFVLGGSQVIFTCSKPTFRRMISLCDQNVRRVEISFSNDSDLCQFHQAVVMPTLFPVGIEIQGAGIVAFVSIPDKVVIGLVS